MEPIIEVSNLIKRYKKADKNAVDGISFSVERGEFFSFLGPNGAGKTTTISILTTTLAKTSGRVTIAGYDIDKNENEIRQNTGVIFQNQSIDLNLTAEENVRFHALLYNMYPFRPTFSMMPDSYKQRLHELADVLDIGSELSQPLKTFSGGMRRKLEIVRSLMHHPRVLFLDEPTSGLDPIARRSLWNYLREVQHKEGTTIFLTTHYIEEAEEADHVAIINDGKIISYGTPSELKEDLVEDYMLVDASNREQLKLELKENNIAFTEGEHLKITLKNGRAQQIIKMLETSLSTLQIHRPTLEDAYLEIIEHDNHNAGS